MTAASVSRYLSANGVRVLPAETSRMREGIRVSQSRGYVRVTVDFDGEREAERTASLVEQLLDDADDGGRFTVTRAAFNAVEVRS